MTKEQDAIDMLSMIKVDKMGEFEPLHTWYSGIDKDMQEAVELAKKALSQPDIEAIRKEIEKQKIMVSGSYLTKDQKDIFRNAINVALAVIDKHLQNPQEHFDWYDVPSDEMTLEQTRQAVKDLRKKLVEHLEQDNLEAIREEIAHFDRDGDDKYQEGAIDMQRYVLRVIDNYTKAESEDNNV